MEENKKLMKLLRKVVDPYKNIDIPALHDKILVLAREGLLTLPKADRDGNLNPTWKTYLPLQVTRQDNSFTMSEKLGEITDSKKRVLGDISRSLTGYIFTVTEKRSGVTLALNCRMAVEWLFNERANFKKTRKKKLEKQKEAA